MALHHLQQLAGRLGLIKPEEDSMPEPYILTPEEEQEVIRNDIESQKKHYAWIQAQRGLSHEQILFMLSKKSWEVERDRILQEANSRKHHRLWESEQRKKDREREIQELLELRSLWTSQYFFKQIARASRTMGRPLEIHDGNLRYYTALCYFLAQDPKLEEDLGYNRKKGLWIRGISGVGKTYPIKIIASNPINPIHVLSMVDINESLRKYGDYDIQSGSDLIYLDDVGTEEGSVKVYGTNVPFFKNFIERYYLQGLPHSRLIISTNLSFDEVEEKYGFRIRSRIREMFNIVDVEGKDLRI